jgi:hypothetical protein
LFTRAFGVLTVIAAAANRGSAGAAAADRD